MERTPRQLSRNWIDRTAAWLLPFHPAAALVSVILLSTRGSCVIRGLKTQRQDLFIWGLLGIIGWISVWQGVNLGRGALNWLVPFAFFWVYALGRWAVPYPERFLRDLLRATSILAFIVVTARLFELEFSIGGIPILDRFEGTRARGYVIGQATNGLAVILEVGAVGGLARLAFTRTTRDRLEAAVTGLLCLGGVLVTLSRGAMVGIASASAVAVVLLNWRILVPAVLLVGLTAAARPYFRDRLLSIFSLQRNAQRLRIWEGTLNLIRDHPWFGVGPGNFGLVYPQYRLASEHEGVSTPHNLYFYITTGWGIPGGLLLFGWIAWVMLRNLNRAMTPYKRVVFLILVAFWVHVLFDDLITVQAGLLLGFLDQQTDDHAAKETSEP